MDITYYFKTKQENTKLELEKNDIKKEKLKIAYQKMIGKLISDQVIDIGDYTFLLDFINCGGCISMLKKYNQILEIILGHDKVSDDTKKKIKYINQNIYKHLFDLFKENGEIDISVIMKGIAELNKNELVFTEDQQMGIKQICQFLYDPSVKTYGLYGVAGSGKSTLITKLVHYFLLHNYIRSVVFTAPTNKAVNILKAKFMNDIQALVEEKTGISTKDDTDGNLSLNDQLDKLDEKGLKVNFSTIHRLLNFKNEFDVNGGLVFVKGKKSCVNNYDLVLIDECSMIPFQIIVSIFEDIRAQLNQFKKTPKVLFIGDPAQLPPVKEKVSVIFAKNNKDIDYNLYIDSVKDGTKDSFKKLQKDIKDHHNMLMTEIVRTSDNVVVGLCNEIRSWVMDQIRAPKMSKYKCPKIKLYKYDPMRKKKKIDTKWFQTCLDYFAANEKTMISNIILTWTNKQSKEYNNVIRKRLFKRTKLNEFEVGDILMLNDFYNIQCTGEKEKFYASEQIKINEIEEVIKVVPPFGASLSNKMGRAKNFVLIDEKYKQAVKNINKVTKRKYNVWKLHVSKLSDVKMKDHIPEYYTIYVLKKDSKDIIQKDKDNIMNKIKELRSCYQGHLKEQLERLDKVIIKQMWKEYNQKFCEPFANVSYAASITVHSSQCSTYYNVFIDSRDILANLNSSDAKRCIYTAMTRVANELHILV